MALLVIIAGGCCIDNWPENAHLSNMTVCSENATYFSDLELTYRMPFKRQTVSGGEGKVGNGGHNKIKMLIFDLVSEYRLVQ
jgi:hypothetical protein